MSHQHKFLTLDALRGIAALLVLTRHTSAYWGGVSFHHAYLAVDLFFMLSGFVISHAYDRKLTNKAMGFGVFLLTRIIRLYPLYLFAAIVSAVVFAPKSAFIQGDAHVMSDYLTSVFLTFLYLPSKLDGNVSLFPINGVCWSLFFEIVANVIYALIRPILSTRNLIIIITMSGICLSALSISMNGIDSGFTWDLTSIVVGLTRTIYGFFFGLLLHRIFLRSAATEMSTIKSILVALIASMPLVFSDIGEANGLLDSFIILFVFPLCILMGARVNPRDATIHVFKVLGIISYPIYLLHASFGDGLLKAFGLMGLNVNELAPYSGLFLVVVLCSFCMLLNRFYDHPVRRSLSQFAFGR